MRNIQLSGNPDSSLPSRPIANVLEIISSFVKPMLPSSHHNHRRPEHLQHELFEMQKRQEAWGLVIPLLEHQDANVQFIGAHTAQVKIARDW